MNTHSNIHKTSDFSKLPERRLQSLTLAGGFFALTILAAPGIQAAVSQPEAAQRALLAESYGKRPLSFEANRGQNNPKVQFLSRGQGYSLFLTSTEAVLTLRKADPASTGRDRVGVTGLRPPPLPHHRTCGFPHPAVGTNGLHRSGFYSLSTPLTLRPLILGLPSMALASTHIHQAFPITTSQEAAVIATPFRFR